MKTQIFSKVSWGGKEKPSKKFEIIANDYDVDLVFSTREAGAEGGFTEVASMKVEKDSFTALARGCFRKASSAINRGSYKSNELTESKMLCDYDWNNRDLMVLRVTSMYKVGGNYKFPTRITRLSVYKFDSWDALREARANTKNGTLQFPSEKCLFSLECNPFSVVHNAWYSEDVQLLDDCDDIFMNLFLKHGSYNSFLERVFSEKKDGRESTDSGYSSTSVPASEPTEPSSVPADDDEFPF